MRHLQEFVSNEDLNVEMGDENEVTEDTDGVIETTESPELDDIEVAQDDVVAETTETATAIDAIAQYTALLKKYEDTGISTESAAFMEVGLSQFNHLFSEESKAVPALEAFGGTSSRRFATQASLEALGERAKELGTKLKELFIKLFNLAKEYFNTLFNDVERLKKRANAMKGQLAGLPKAPAKLTIEVSNPGALMVGNKFLADDVTPIAGVVKWASETYPNSMEQFLKKAAARAKGLSDVTEAVADLKQTESPRSRFAASIANMAGEGKLPGNTVIAFKGDDDTFSQVVTVEKAERQVETIGWGVQTPRELATRLSQLITVLDGLERARDYPQRMEQPLKQLTEALDSGATTHPFFADLVRAGTTGLSDVLKYLYKTLGAYLAVLQQEINAYGAGRQGS